MLNGETGNTLRRGAGAGAGGRRLGGAELGRGSRAELGRGSGAELGRGPGADAARSTGACRRAVLSTFGSTAAEGASVARTPSDASRHIETPGAFRIFANNLIRSPSLMCFALAFLALPKSKFKSSITSTALNLSQPIILSAAVGAAVFMWNKSLQDKYSQKLENIGNAAIQPLKYLETLFSRIPSRSLEKMNSLALASIVIMAMSFKLSPLKFDANLSASYLLAGLLFACPPQELSQEEMRSWNVTRSGVDQSEINQKVHDYKSFAVLMPVIVTNLLAVTISSLLIMKRGITEGSSLFLSFSNVKVSTPVSISSAMIILYYIGVVHGRRDVMFSGY